MEIEVKLFATLQKYLPGGSGSHSCRLQMGGEAQVKDVLARLDLAMEMPKIILLNGLRCDSESKLKEGDVLSIFPPVGGG